jgi:very-short-patch-repair endonuclease
MRAVRDAPHHRDLVEMAFTWQDIERVVAQRHPDLAAALDQAYRVEAVAGENDWCDPHNVFALYFDPSGDREAIRAVRDARQSLHRVIEEHVQLYDGRVSHKVRVLPPDALQGEPDEGAVECERLNPRRTNVSVEDVPMPKPSGTGVPFEQIDGYLLTPIEVPFYKALRETAATFAVQPFVQGTDGYYRPDFIVFYDGNAVVVELDGHEGHKTKEQRTKDSRRERWFESRGMRVMRFTGTEVWADADECVKSLLDVLRRSQSKF